MPLTPEQIGNVADIIMMSYSATASLVSGFNSTEIAMTLADITEFAKVKNNFTNIKIDGAEITREKSRLAIRNRVRVRLNLLPLSSETDNLTGSSYSTIEYSHPEEC